MGKDVLEKIHRFSAIAFNLSVNSDWRDIAWDMVPELLKKYGLTKKDLEDYQKKIGGNFRNLEHMQRWDYAYKLSRQIPTEEERMWRKELKKRYDKCWKSLTEEEREDKEIFREDEYKEWLRHSDVEQLWDLLTEYEIYYHPPSKRALLGSIIQRQFKAKQPEWSIAEDERSDVNPTIDTRSITIESKDEEFYEGQKYTITINFTIENQPEKFHKGNNKKLVLVKKGKQHK